MHYHKCPLRPAASQGANEAPHGDAYGTPSQDSTLMMHEVGEPAGPMLLCREWPTHPWIEASHWADRTVSQTPHFSTVFINVNMKIHKVNTIPMLETKMMVA